MKKYLEDEPEYLRMLALIFEHPNSNSRQMAKYLDLDYFNFNKREKKHYLKIKQFVVRTKRSNGWEPVWNYRPRFQYRNNTSTEILIMWEQAREDKSSALVHGDSSSRSKEVDLRSP